MTKFQRSDVKKTVLLLKSWTTRVANRIAEDNCMWRKRDIRIYSQKMEYGIYSQEFPRIEWILRKIFGRKWTVWGSGTSAKYVWRGKRVTYSNGFTLDVLNEYFDKIIRSNFSLKNKTRHGTFFKYFDRNILRRNVNEVNLKTEHSCIPFSRKISE